MSSETPTADTDRNNRHLRRRQADRDADAYAADMEREVGELRAFAQNHVTRRLARWLWPVLVAGLLAGWAKWKGIPSPEWQAKVEQQQQLEAERYQQMAKEFDVLKAEVKWNVNLSAAQRKEILDRIDGLEAKLERWFVRAGRGER